MFSQDEILGSHPIAPSFFEKWFHSDNIKRTKNRCHRALSSKLASNDSELISWLANKIIEHHYSPSKLRRLRRMYKNIGFPAYANQHRQIPSADRTMKGNATEIILIEYILGCNSDRTLIKCFKFHYNPNVNQSMKGDDALIIDVINSELGKEEIKVFLGEAKFRSKPDKAVVSELSNAISKDKLPLSYTFLLDRLYDNDHTVNLAEFLEKFILDEIKSKGNMKYAGLLLSNDKTSDFIEKNYTNDNPDAVIISVGIDDPKSLIYNAFYEANAIINNPTAI
ncbi:protein of unknown function [Chryseobacterium taichungense]|uniref:DUF1837 domain-containing protein n=2 Tax=Chryseobacterium TaxID=59732 RepID=A0AAD1DMZ4_9FLAO|nr:MULTISPECIES: Hachiman antiphage defense system protein HamA [Chryseobacterium]MCT4319237.1 DUF1837 domain-containing protein [Elizabethkingia anophelis]AZA87590.1 DUF1837 domain-containing protein [Chryseobacterium shandongense]AZA96089.1 DUF1837 domain-containing protein [Chryseobacterium shandongense]MEB4760214.1 SAVED domain-containing protein [Chryseobacterium indologenes]UMQ40568.1 DUF1837 domain-containing protein [Chryseobacterium sp. Y16C]